MAETVEGACRCGQVKFRTTGRPLTTMACHCTGCQRMTASAFSLSSLFADEKFQIMAGETAIGGLHGPDRHFFCPRCMSWLFSRPQGADGLVNVRATLLEDAHDYRPFMETWTREALPWVRTGAVHSFEALPAQDEFGPLMQAFAEWDAR